MDDRLEELRRRLRALGFDEVRFAATQPALAPEPLRAWLAAGQQGDMAWMDRSADKRLDPDRVLPGVRSIVLLGVNYWRSDPAAGPRWARYALYQDYHDAIMPALVAGGRAIEELYGASGSDYRYYVDTGPVLERAWAARAGLGFVGKNAMLISRDYGNWLFLAAILTRVELAPDRSLAEDFPAAAVDRPGGVGLLCGKCSRCLDACPTQAFAAPGMIDARRCVSYQTIENRGVIPRELRAGIGERIYGCDVCLEVCPWNRFAQQGREVLLTVRGEIAALGLGELLELTPERFAVVFRGTPIKRVKLAGLLRNACVVAGNTGDRSVLPALLRLARHESSLVRAHAVWAVHRLGAGGELAAARAAESDAQVLAEYAAEQAAAGAT